MSLNVCSLHVHFVSARKDCQCAKLAVINEAFKKLAGNFSVLVPLMATKFATASTNYEQLDAMF